MDGAVVWDDVTGYDVCPEGIATARREYVDYYNNIDIYTKCTSRSVGIEPGKRQSRSVVWMLIRMKVSVGRTSIEICGLST